MSNPNTLAASTQFMNTNWTKIASFHCLDKVNTKAIPPLTLLELGLLPLLITIVIVYKNMYTRAGIKVTCQNYIIIFSQRLISFSKFGGVSGLK